MNGFAHVTDEQRSASLTLNLMLAAGRGSIVTASPANAFLPDPKIIDYSAAKAALTNFSKAPSKEVGAAGIRVNTVSPRPVATDPWLGPNDVAASIAQANGIEPAAVAKTSRRGRGYRPIHKAD